MKKSKNEFLIHFIGLKLGAHTYEFDIDQTFFEGVENAPIENANVHVVLTLEKKETMMIALFQHQGTISTNCSRCNDIMTIDTTGNLRIIYKFGTEQSDDENLVILHPDSYELDVRVPIYELLVTSIPNRLIHHEGECNEDVMKLYSKFVVNANEPDDFIDDEDWDEDEDDWDDWDEGDWEDEEDTEPDDNKPIDSRWSALKNLN